MTVEELVRSGKMAPGGQRRLEDALRPAPTGPALEAATREFVARREAFRKVLVDALEAQQLDALLYPANQARPHTHEGGAERYGTEPGTCEESAATGLPQVTVPAGLPRRPLPGRHLVPRPDVGRPAAAGDWLRLRAGDATSAPAGDRQVACAGPASASRVGAAAG